MPKDTIITSEPAFTGAVKSTDNTKIDPDHLAELASRMFPSIPRDQPRASK
ncbi:MAG: hypothetical protein HRT94_00935 [Alphaproteobacteria bacterium]|nr:hypothetical protein [Alphaproteobacteria bacterium]